MSRKATTHSGILGSEQSFASLLKQGGGKKEKSNIKPTVSNNKEMSEEKQRVGARNGRAA